MSLLVIIYRITTSMYGEYGYVGKKICVLSVGMCVCKCMCVRTHAHTPQTARDRMSKAQSWMVAQLLMISPVTQLQDRVCPLGMAICSKNRDT